MDNLGKKYEIKFAEDWKKIPNTSIDRLYDTMGGYSGVRNISDFIIYNYPYIIYGECKTVKGNTFPLSKLTQYEKLLTKRGIKGVISGVFIWFYEKDSVIFVPIDTIHNMKADGEKSVNCKKVVDNLYEKGYNIIVIPSIKLRTFMDSDYSVILRDDLANISQGVCI